MTIGDALSWATGLVASSGTDTPRLDAEVLLGHVLALSRAHLYAHWNEPLAPEASKAYHQLVLRRAAREPVAYLIGEKAFYDVELFVDRCVLIPRPETEHLVDAALAWCCTQRMRPLTIADVGTGSGALAVVLACHYPAARVWAVDISAEALSVARRNVERHGLEARITLVRGDLLGSLVAGFDLIVANLPYVARGELSGLPADVARYEPWVALDGGEDGLEVIRRLLSQVPGRLGWPGLLLLEIDPRQGDAAAQMVRAALPDADVTLLLDYAGLRRVVRAERRSGPPPGIAAISGGDRS
jgi:release factor glutamine methyltransferase